MQYVTVFDAASRRTDPSTEEARQVKKFDWIDIAYSREEQWDDKIVEKDFHTSTASLISQKLRKLPAFRPKIMLLMRTDDVFEISDTDYVLHIEAKFPFGEYQSANAGDRLRIFASWILHSVAKACPHLIRQSDVREMLLWVERENYTYIRRDRTRPDKASASCVVTYTHSPIDVDVRVRCAKAGLTLTLPAGLFPRNELVYGKAVSSCSIDAGELVVETFEGQFRGADRDKAG